MSVRLRSRLSELLALLGAVVIGAALVTGCLVLAETGVRSAPPAERLAGVDVVVGGDQKIRQHEDIAVRLPDHVGAPTGLVGELADLPGVAAAAGDVGFPATVTDGQGRGLGGDGGHGWSALLGTVGLTGAAPAGPNEVVLAEGAAVAAGASVGDPVEVLLRGQPTQLRVSGIADLPGTTVFVTDDLARDLSHRPAETVDLITLRLEEGVDPSLVLDRVEEVVRDHGLVVSTGDDIGRAEQPAAGAGTGMLLAIALSGGGVVVLLVGFLVAGAVSVAVANRSRELALLRAVGATPGQIRAMTAWQVSRVALVGSVVGGAVGYLLAALLPGPLVSAGLLATGQELRWSPVPGLAAALLVLGVTQVAARAGSWRVSRLPATEAVVETQTEPRSAGEVRTRIGLVVLVLFLASTAVPLVRRSEAALISAATGTLLAVIGVALVAPATVARVGRWLAPRTRTASRWLAVRNSGSYALRTGGAIAILCLAVGLVITQVYTGTTVSAVTEHEVESGTRADALVSAADGVPAAALAEVTDLASVDAAVPVVATTVVRTSEEGGKVSADAHAALAAGQGVDQVLDLAVVDGDLAKLTGDTVAVDSTTAWLAGVGVGDTVTLSLSDGTPVEPTVVAKYGRGFGFGAFVLSLDLLPVAAGGPFDAVLVSGGTGDGAATLRGDLEDRLGGWPGLQVGDAADVAAGVGGQDPTRWLNLGFSVILMGYVLVGVANRLVATTLRRRREWQVLRAIGVTPRQLAAMARAETWLVCAGAVGTGLLVSLGPMMLVAIGFVGRPWPLGPAWVVGVTILVVCLVAQVATLVPTRHLLRGGGPPVPSGST